MNKRMIRIDFDDSSTTRILVRAFTIKAGVDYALKKFAKWDVTFSALLQDQPQKLTAYWEDSNRLSSEEIKKFSARIENGRLNLAEAV